MSEHQIRKAMKHPNILGAGAKKRRESRMSKKDKVHTVMKEFSRGTLHSGSGKIVKKRSQAIAIAMSEAGMSRKKDKGFYGHTTCQTLF